MGVHTDAATLVNPPAPSWRQELCICPAIPLPVYALKRLLHTIPGGRHENVHHAIVLSLKAFLLGNVAHRQVKLTGNHRTSVDNIREHCQPPGEPAFTFLKSTPQETTHLTLV